MLDISPQLLKRAFLSIALTVTMSTGMAFAQSSASDPGMVNPNPSETHTMDNYLNNNPRIAKELHENPSLINDPKWLSEHPKVQNWMNSHPTMKTDAATRTSQFVNQTERHDLKVDHQALNGTDAFMKNHPQVAGELKNDPNLINDPNYLAKHPQLDNYLAKHPEVRKDWQEHPKEFAKAAERNNRYNEAHEGHSPATTPHKAPAAHVHK